MIQVGVTQAKVSQLVHASEVFRESAEWVGAEVGMDQVLAVFHFQRQLNQYWTAGEREGKIELGMGI